MQLFDYIFYRVFIIYNKKRNELPILRGCLTVALLLFLSILSLITLYSIFFKYPIDDSIKPFAMLLMITILILVALRYAKKNRINKLLIKYENEKSNSKIIKGWLIITYIILVFAIPISVGYMRHNLGMDI